ncbi:MULTISPECIES: Hsp70 family protein [unclassified Duganella]|uniref:Hsp70 family protein n=1 Tax=unclassified Duganella TaxID=2636909 RepID=UPI00087E58E3|nr:MULTISPECIES: Hsp70 family protein [unclassified Duganella]SDF46376.1 Hsp70 protein [Duganella sp. OV458]SDI80429.1 Hsp70 protein [Duganella sp. OV510]
MSKYVVSIDLGTTNTVMAFAEAGSAQIQLFDIDQLTAPGEVGAAALLPSLRYHPADGELAAGELQLPWPQQDAAQVVIGQLARKLGAQVPGRLVASAKSWLSHPQVDRMAPILPWGAEADVAKVSPVAASASYLAHLRSAWDARFPAHPLHQQQIVLTIPASFDEGARALTLEAARMAGLPSLRLLEEPQAAFYDWLFRQRAALAEELAETRLVLVCDVGGGTTDFSLMKVDASAGGQPAISRIGVGNHLILGGDNMDLALAHLVEARLTGGAPRGDTPTGSHSAAGEEARVASPPQAKLSASRLSQLAERCRAAKELLLAADAPQRTTVTLLGTGSKLIGGSRSAELTRDEVSALVVDGFFPLNETQSPAKRGRGAIVEFGLPYAADAAITRHLADFLRQHAAATREALDLPADSTTIPIPDTLLLNGGVFRADALARRLEATLAGWRQQPLRVLHNDNPDVAVARGGVAYALGQSGQAPVIGGGSARSYFLLLDDAGPSDKPRRAICILPRGAAENRELLLADRTFALRLGRPVRFHLASSTSDAPRAGHVIELQPDEYIQLPPIATVLRDSSAADARKEIPVQLAAMLSEVGTLEVHCVAKEDKQRWLLEFQLRGETTPEASVPDEAPMPAGLAAAIEKIDRIFGSRAQQVDLKEVKQLRVQLEHLLGSRESWITPLLRHLFDALMQRAKGRRRSSEHERAWLNLSGYCLRPGFGHTLDEWRIEQLWALFDSGVQNHKDSQTCAEWWTLWRRVSGGLSVDAQLRVLDDFAFNVQADAAERGRRPVTLVNGSEEDMLRLGASLERIPGNYKAEIGAWMLDQLQKAGKAAAKATANKTRSGAGDLAKAEATQGRFLWGLSRVGARQPFHGSAHDVVDTAIVEQWLDQVLKLDWKKTEPAGFAAAHLARMTGDRSRDINDTLRAEVLRRLHGVGAPANWSAMVREVVQLDQADEKRMLGDALPPGLKLLS